jgi:FAD/FMN-containing dehydrogenase
MGQKPSSGIGKCLLDNVPNNLVALPGKIDYMLADVKPYNLAVEVNPAAVTYPNSSEYISAIVRCANTWNMKVQARSGGHSYGNYGVWT